MWPHWKIAFGAATTQTLFNLQNSASLLFHYYCHCYYVIFLIRRSRLREQHCFPADSPVKLCLQQGPQLLLLSTQSRSRGFTPLCVSAMCTMCCRAKGFSFSCGILPRQPLETGPPVAPCWCSGWQACSLLLSAPRCPGNRLLHSSSRGDDAALIDNNGKWQNRWETREGCV